MAPAQAAICARFHLDDATLAGLRGSRRQVAALVDAEVDARVSQVIARMRQQPRARNGNPE